MLVELTDKVHNKAGARELAIDWQQQASELDYSCYELYEWSEKFRKIGKRYGLLKEFKENGII